MKRKDYQKPTMKVVECESTAELLAASGSGSLQPSGSESLQDYNWNNYEEE